MDAVKYLKEIFRMCDSMKDCTDCPLYKCNLTFPCKGPKGSVEYKYTEKCVAEVEKWSAEHPAKTRQSEFLKMFPNARLEDGIIKLAPCFMDTKCKCEFSELDPCFDCRKKYWLAEIE